MTLPQIADSMAGRMEIADLLPLSQCELIGDPGDFLGRVFKGKQPISGKPITGAKLIQAVLSGGYPEALNRNSWSRRQKWFGDYVKAIIERDVRDIAHIDQIRQMPRLLRSLAHHSGQLVNYSGLGAPLGMNHVTAQKYTTVLENIFHIRTLEPWYTNELKRLVKTPKLHFLDSGLLAALRNLSPARLQSDRTPFGALLETFVLGELLKIASWSGKRFGFYHFRDRYDNEVDIVVENEDGLLVGVEVKAAATVRSEDFSGMRKLAEASGRRFTLGLVLYDGDSVIPFDGQMFAAPISTLWGISKLSRT